MPKHHLAVDLIEKEIKRQVNLRDYYARLSENWPSLAHEISRCDEEIASLQHTREVLVLIG